MRARGRDAVRDSSRRPARAQDAAAAAYPDSIIKIVVCVPPGVDVVTRLVADRLRQRLGEPVMVENRGGQAGNLGAETVYAAEPDGYTLLASPPAPLTMNGLICKKINYDPSAFVPVAIMTSIPNTLVVREDFPAKTAEEFIAYAKAHPGQLNYASQGLGTTSHLTAELFQAESGTNLMHVPYKGTAPAINDILASPDVRAVLGKLNMQPQKMTPAEATAFVRADARRWTDAIRSARMLIN